MIGSEQPLDLYEFTVKHWLTALFGIISTILATGYRRTTRRFQKEKESNKAVQAGLKALLADRITEIFIQYTEKGYCPICARSNAELLFHAYHSLGGNGTMTELYNRLLAMPTEIGAKYYGAK